MKHLLCCAILVAAPPLCAQDVPSPQPSADEALTLRQPAALRIAVAYGFHQWKHIAQLDFTFNVQTPSRSTSRHWTWWPRENRATRQIKGQTPVSFPLAPGSIMLPQDAELTDEQVSAHAQFVNDSYWFLFPFQIVWSDPQVTDHGQAPLPIGGQSSANARKVTVQYPADGGYTPGDAYDLYLDDDHRIIQWVFRRGGGEKGSPASWENVVALGPLVVSLDRFGPNRTFHLSFTDVSAVVADDVGQTATFHPAPLEDD